MVAGNGTAETSVILEVDGAERLRAIANASGTGSETMQRRIWDLRPFQGKPGVIVINDLASGPWGHINVDDFRYYSRP